MSAGITHSFDTKQICVYCGLTREEVIGNDILCEGYKDSHQEWREMNYATGGIVSAPLPKYGILQDAIIIRSWDLRTEKSFTKFCNNLDNFKGFPRVP